SIDHVHGSALHCQSSAIVDYTFKGGSASARALLHCPCVVQHRRSAALVVSPGLIGLQIEQSASLIVNRGSAAAPNISAAPTNRASAIDCSLRESFYAATADKQARAMRNRTCSRPSHAAGGPGECSIHRERPDTAQIPAAQRPMIRSPHLCTLHRRYIRIAAPARRKAAIDIDCSATKAYR